MERAQLREFVEALPLGDATWVGERGVAVSAGQGKVVQRGSRASLLRAGGLYRRLWDLQRQALPPS